MAKIVVLGFLQKSFLLFLLKMKEKEGLPVHFRVRKIGPFPKRGYHTTGSPVFHG
jgi:hypothetical protein